LEWIEYLEEFIDFDEGIKSGGILDWLVMNEDVTSFSLLGLNFFTKKLSRAVLVMFQSG
jgi:hypothetical protein